MKKYKRSEASSEELQFLRRSLAKTSHRCSDLEHQLSRARGVDAERIHKQLAACRADYRKLRKRMEAILGYA